MCSLTVTAAGNSDIQTRTRLTTLALAEPVMEIDSGQLKRHIRYFPESRDYTERLNFRFYYRLQAERFYGIAGFGATGWVDVDRMQAVNPFSFAEEGKALQQLNRRLSQHTKLTLWAVLDSGIRRDAPMLAIGLDANGVDFRQQWHVLHCLSQSPISSVAEGIGNVTRQDI